MPRHRYLTTLVLALLCIACTLPVYADSHNVDMHYTDQDPLGAKDVWCRLGQRLVIPDRYVTEIGYRVWRIGVPTGNVTFAVHNATTDEPIVSVTWGDASQLPGWPADASNVTKVVLATPIKISGDVRLFVEYHGGDENNYCVAGYCTGDKITGEWYTNYYHYNQWHDIHEAEEGSYHYAWIDPEDLESNVSATMPVWIAIPISLLVVGICLHVRRRRSSKLKQT